MCTFENKMPTSLNGHLSILVRKAHICIIAYQQAHHIIIKINNGEDSCIIIPYTLAMCCILIHVINMIHNYNPSQRSCFLALSYPPPPPPNSIS